MIPGTAEHTVVLEHARVHDLMDTVQRPERRDRAHLEPLEVAPDLVFGGQPKRTASIQHHASLAEVEAPRGRDHGQQVMIAVAQDQIFRGILRRNARSLSLGRRREALLVLDQLVFDPLAVQVGGDRLDALL